MRATKTQLWEGVRLRCAVCSLPSHSSNEDTRSIRARKPKFWWTQAHNVTVGEVVEIAPMMR